jgi:hypothetical protein
MPEHLTNLEQIGAWRNSQVLKQIGRQPEDTFDADYGQVLERVYCKKCWRPQRDSNESGIRVFRDRGLIDLGVVCEHVAIQRIERGVKCRA